MEKKDFKKITKQHIRICKEILEEDGACLNINCLLCPFDKDNSYNNKLCINNGYSISENKQNIDSKLIKSCEEFIKFLEYPIDNKEYNLLDI